MPVTQHAEDQRCREKHATEDRWLRGMCQRLAEDDKAMLKQAVEGAEARDAALEVKSLDINEAIHKIVYRTRDSVQTSRERRGCTS
jgi:hypothetical protein